jgi:CRP/FNR family cyclic AMP-dependent transcriptional regulator
LIIHQQNLRDFCLMEWGRYGSGWHIFIISVSNPVPSLPSRNLGDGMTNDDRDKDGGDGESPGRRNLEGRNDGAERRGYKENHFVFREGETGDLAFIVIEGVVQIFKTSGDRQVLLGTITKGGMFGEMALIDDQPRMASARVDGGPATMLLVSRLMFEKKLNGLDPFSRGLIKILSAKARGAAEVELQQNEYRPDEQAYDLMNTN